MEPLQCMTLKFLLEKEGKEIKITKKKEKGEKRLMSWPSTCQRAWVQIKAHNHL